MNISSTDTDISNDNTLTKGGKRFTLQELQEILTPSFCKCIHKLDPATLLARVNAELNAAKRYGCKLPELSLCEGAKLTGLRIEDLRALQTLGYDLLTPYERPKFSLFGFWMFLEEPQYENGLRHLRALIKTVSEAILPTI